MLKQNRERFFLIFCFFFFFFVQEMELLEKTFFSYDQEKLSDQKIGWLQQARKKQPGVICHLFGLAILQFGNLAILQLGNFTIWEFYNSAILQFGNFTIWRFYNLAILIISHFKSVCILQNEIFSY